MNTLTAPPPKEAPAGSVVDMFYTSPCPFKDYCPIEPTNGTGCDLKGTEHSDCAFYLRAERATHLKLCVHCGAVYAIDREWVVPLGGKLVHEKDGRGNYGWKYPDGSSASLLPGVICRDCNPKKEI